MVNFVTLLINILKCYKISYVTKYYKYFNLYKNTNILLIIYLILKIKNFLIYFHVIVAILL